MGSLFLYGLLPLRLTLSLFVLKASSIRRLLIFDSISPFARPYSALPETHDGAGIDRARRICSSLLRPHVALQIAGVKCITMFGRTGMAFCSNLKLHISPLPHYTRGLPMRHHLLKGTLDGFRWRGINGGTICERKCKQRNKKSRTRNLISRFFLYDCSTGATGVHPS